MNDFFKKLTGFSIGPIIGALIGFITIPITTHFVAPTEYGKASMFTLVQTIITMVVYLGLDQAYVRFYHEEDNKKKLLFNSMIIPLVVSVIAIVLLPINPQIISKMLFEDPQYIMPVYALMITIPLIIFERFILLSIRMQEKGAQYSVFSIILKLVTFFATLLFVLKIRTDFLAVVYSSIIGQIIGDIVLIIIYRKSLTLNFKFLDKTLLKSLLKFGLPLLVYASLAWVLNSMDRIFLRIYSNFQQMGYYTIAMKMTSLLLIIQTCFTTFWVPTAYRWYNEKVDNKQFGLVSNSLFFVMSIAFLGILLFKDLIVIIMPTYKQSIYIMPFLLFYPMMYTVSETTTLGIAFSKKSYFNIVASILAVVTNIVLNIMLIPKYNAIGAAIAMGIAYIIFFWTRTIISRQLWHRFPIRKYIIITFVLLIAALFNTIELNKILMFLINFSCMIVVFFIYKNLIKEIFSKFKFIKKISH
ncbi:MAG: oligosaccharide flippase family protein [Oscillospiraceae bacterium]|nr:oligosaccharide flippase family protein [Oscillospiraceae bacterium]